MTTLNGDFVSPSILSGMDAGQGMVSVLNQLPISHCCLGNHEADIKLDQLVERTLEFGGKWLNSNIPSLVCHSSPYDLVRVTTDDGQSVLVGVIGLLTSETGTFRNDKFRGIPIDDTIEAAGRWSRVLRDEHGVEAIIALTHQSIHADEALAASGHVDLILGGLARRERTLMIP